MGRDMVHHVRNDRPMTAGPEASVPHDHVQLRAGTASSGEPVYELVPVVAVEPDVYDVVGSPVLVYGCAAGDRIRVAPDGQFEVLDRGGNVCLVIFPSDQSTTATNIDQLRASYERLGGTTESPPDGRFIVVTVPVTAGFPAIERAVQDWLTDVEGEWAFGNVYDEDDRPLNWWLDR
jgi:hypothetical protein